MRLTRTILITALLALGAVACSNTFTAGAAVVNGVSISQERLDRQVDAATGGTDSAPVTDEARLAQARDLLSQFIQQELIRQEAIERGIEVAEEQIDAEMAQIQAGRTDEQFLELVEQAGFTVEEVRDQIWIRNAVDRLRVELAPSISERELRDLYEASENEFTEAEIKHILFRVESEEDDARAERRASRTLVEIEGGARFGALARERSEDPGSAANGGDLGGFIALNQLDLAFANAARTATIGEVTEPVRSQFGWHLILVTDRRTAPFSEVRADLEQRLVGQAGDQAFQGLLNELTASGDIQVNPRYGDWDPETGTIIPHTFFERPEPETDPLAPPDDLFQPPG